MDRTYVFKVSLAKDLWRRIEIAADHTLLDLHRAIQKAYNFDDDHLYSFLWMAERGRMKDLFPLMKKKVHGWMMFVSAS